MTAKKRFVDPTRVPPCCSPARPAPVGQQRLPHQRRAAATRAANTPSPVRTDGSCQFGLPRASLRTKRTSKTSRRATSNAARYCNVMMRQLHNSQRTTSSGWISGARPTAHLPKKHPPSHGGENREVSLCHALLRWSGQLCRHLLARWQPRRCHRWKNRRWLRRPRRPRPILARTRCHPCLLRLQQSCQPSAARAVGRAARNA